MGCVFSIRSEWTSVRTVPPFFSDGTAFNSDEERTVLLIYKSHTLFLVGPQTIHLFSMFYLDYILAPSYKSIMVFL